MAEKTKIFLVDDDPIFMEMLHDSLSDNSNYELHKFHSTEDCIENLNLIPHIIILDHLFKLEHGKKSMSGLDALLQIKAITSEAKIIMLTSQQDGDLVFEFIKAGAEDYVIKDENAFDNICNLIQEFQLQ